MKKISKLFILLLFDILFINISYAFALLLRFEFDMNEQGFITFMDVYLNNMIIINIIGVVVLYLFGMYKSLWRYASIDELLKTTVASLVMTVLVVIYFMLRPDTLPRSTYVMAFVFNTALIGGLRFAYRILRRLNGRKDMLFKPSLSKNVMIIGAGDAGAAIIKEFNAHGELHSIPKVAIDDDVSKQKKSILGVPIAGGTDVIKEMAEKHEIDEIVIAIPSANKRKISEIVEHCNETGCKLKILPSLFELIDGQVSVSKLRDVHIEDLLGRDEVKVDLDEITSYVKDKVVIITGGGGSIGSELCRQIAGYGPKKLVAFDIYENSIYEIRSEIGHDYPQIDFEGVIGSIRDEERVREMFDTYKPQVIFHAAAHKHVPLMEADPKEAVKNNIFGTKRLLDFAYEYNLERFVLISTDKAVNPTNVMGATKRTAEMLMQEKSKESKTIFSAVRFGNVLGSNGSVIPIFKKQIENGGPVTVTHKDVTRFFMTIPEAVQLVIQAGAMANGGEIFILDMGEPVKIMDLAENLIRLSGYKPYEDIEIEVTGLRPGEKLYEELLLDEEGISHTVHEKIFIGQPIAINKESLYQNIEILSKNNASNQETKEIIKQIVPTYTPNGDGSKIQSNWTEGQT